MAFRVQVRRDTGQRWSLNNPILLSGEMGFNIDTSQFKIGDGVTPWNSLSYWNGGIGPAGTNGVTGPTGAIGPTGPTGTSYTPNYRVYTALLTQSATNPPTAQILENTLGNVTYEYLSLGLYKINLPITTPGDNVWVSLTNNRNGDEGYIQYEWTGNLNYITILTTYIDYGSPANIYSANGILNKTSIEIRVYS